MSKYYILLRDLVATEINGILNPHSKHRKQQALKGSLWTDDNVPTEAFPRHLKLYSVDTKPSQTLECANNEVSNISQEVYRLLNPIPTCDDRYKVFQDQSWLSEALQMKEGSIVLVLKQDKNNENFIGTIRFRGLIDDGMYFGVELAKEFEGRGTTDGEFRLKRYFLCKEDCAVFVTINKLRLYTKSALSKSNTKLNEQGLNIPVEHDTYSDDRSLSPPPLEIGERVVWVGDEGHHFGTVHWLGVLPDAREAEWTVGVEFDEPIGTGTGRYNDVQLFKAKNKHASLIPLIGLIKASEFGADPTIQNATNDIISHDIHAIDVKSKTAKRSGTVLDENYYKESYGMNRDSVFTSGKPRSPEDTSHYAEIGYPNTLAHGGNISRVSSTHENFLDDPTYARVHDLPTRLRSSASPVESSLGATGGHVEAGRSRMTQSNNSERTYAQVHRPSENSEHHTTLSSPLPPPAYNELYDTEDIIDSRPVSEKTHLTQTDAYGDDKTRFNPIGAATTITATENIVHSHTQRHSASQHTMHTEESSLTLISGSSTNQQSVKTNGFGTESQTNQSASSTIGRARSVDPRSLGLDYDLGTMVEVTKPGLGCRYGVIRWVGQLGDKPDIFVGLEMEEESSVCTHGTFGGQQLFTLPEKKAFFTYIRDIQNDSRFQESESICTRRLSQAFGSLDCPDVTEIVPPPQLARDLTFYLGKQKGIQGHHNSCYLDVTLFSMFAFTDVFDSLLIRPPGAKDIAELHDVQIIIREGIVYPLRKNFYVRADKVLKLRTLLEKVTNLTGLMTEEKDPEEFLNCLLQNVLNAPPFLVFSSDMESYLYQLFIEKETKLVLPTTEQLLELSFVQNKIKFKVAPSRLIIQMPRFGKDYKMYKKILPSLEIDITDLLEYGPRECFQCGRLARYECPDCFNLHENKTALDKCSFCHKCITTFHGHPARKHHQFRPLERNRDFEEYVDAMERLGYNILDEPIPRQKMELFAVICIETSHYVAFVKCGRGLDAPWVFFDSMADRRGEQNGYNIPEVKHCRFLPDLLKEESFYDLVYNIDVKTLEQNAQRLLSDAYICMYQSKDRQMYE